MGVDSLSPLRTILACTSCILALFLVSVTLFSGNGLAKPVERATRSPWFFHDSQQIPLGDQSRQSAQPVSSPQDDGQHPFPDKPGGMNDTLRTMLDALDVMQSEYFVIWQGTWPSGNDWTRAVMATQVSATLSAISWRLDDILSSNPEATDDCGSEPFDSLAYENLINHYFQHTSAFWFGEDYISLRFQAYDDMLWVVLEWLENLKFQDLHSELHYSSYSNESIPSEWHGTQFGTPAAHRARVFYELASQGWDESLCDGGMIWSPHLLPYKNAITNELFISASIEMYMHFPGDSIEIPFAGAAKDETASSQPGSRDLAYLNAAVISYEWLRDSKMLGINNLYADGFHIRGWSERDPGTEKCDELNRMAYTYNQGVILSGIRGLWLATGVDFYLEDGHELVRNVMKSTGWPDKSGKKWKGLGRGGVLEDTCDSSGRCSQDGHTFKGIFFHHFAEFCRPLHPSEERFLVSSLPDPTDDSELRRRRRAFRWHQKECSSYRSWIEHNAHAAYVTMDDEGKFGMWWGREYPDYTSSAKTHTSNIPPGAIDYRNEAFTVENMVRSDRGRDGLAAKGRHTLSQGTRSGTSQGEDTDPSNVHGKWPRDVNDRGRGRTVETQAGALAVFRALWHWQTAPSLAEDAYK